MSNKNINIQTPISKIQTQLLTPHEAATFLGFKSKTTVLHLANRGILPYTKVGSRKRFTYELLMQYLEDNTKRPQLNSLQDNEAKTTKPFLSKNNTQDLLNKI